MTTFKRYYFWVCLLMCFGFNLNAQSIDIQTLNLETCIALALENNLSLKRTEVNLATSEANLLQNQGQRLPSFSTGASSGYRWGRSINPVTNLFETKNWQYQFIC